MVFFKAAPVQAQPSSDFFLKKNLDVSMLVSKYLHTVPRYLYCFTEHPILLIYYMQYWPSSFMKLRKIFHPTRLLGTFSPYSFKGFLPKSPPPRLLALLVY